MLSGEGQLSFVIDGPVFELEFLPKLKKKIKTDPEAFKMFNIKFERLQRDQLDVVRVRNWNSVSHGVPGDKLLPP